MMSESLAEYSGVSRHAASMCRSTTGSASVVAKTLKLPEAANRKAASAGAGP